jgi:glycosyltransferase involved in cell wall biosynthesis
MGVRKNIHELVAYLRQNRIAHFIAHPLYAQNEKLTADHIEKMLLLFAVFEVKNGSRAKRYNRFMEHVLSSLTIEKVEFFANKHGIEPYGDFPWQKGLVGGSDDHSGFFIGQTCTASPDGGTVTDFLNSIKERHCWAEGEDGDALTLAHSLYGIGYNFYRERFGARKGRSTPFINALLSRFFAAGEGEQRPFLERIKLFVKKNLPEFYDSYDGRTFEEILDREAKRLLNDAGFMASISAEGRNRKIFAVTSYLANRIIYIYTERLVRMKFNSGFFDLVHSLSTIGLVHLLVSPYYLAFHHQHRSKSLIAELEERFYLEGEGKRQKIALFTDTLHEINGVAITIKRMIQTAKNQGVELVVITSTPAATSFSDGVMNFRCIGDFSLPEYPELKLHFPPILDVIDYFEREGFTRIHVSTPGTLGLLALFMAKLMDVPVAATYHTDIPQYVRSLTNDEFLENAAWQYMIWFYNQMAEVTIPSASTRAQLVEHGLPEEKTKPLPRWVNTEQFSPAKRDTAFWEQYGMSSGVKFLYVGRVSKEKNLELLADAFAELAVRDKRCWLVVVGDGPYRPELEERLKGYPVLFTGFMEGDDLGRVYASADVFVFPSTTDTFGNVVLEAQASGLPVIVSDEGGPQELMVNGETGLVTRSGSKAQLLEAMTGFTEDPGKISSMGRNARAFTEARAINTDTAYSTILHTRPKAVND